MYNNANIYDKFQTLDSTEAMLYELLFISCDTIIELACGTGRLFSVFEDKHYVGVDLSFQMLKKFKQKHNYDLLICGDIGQLPIKRKFDGIILSLNSIHHLNHEQLNSLLQEIEKISTSGSILVIEMTDFKEVPWVDGEYSNEYFEYSSNTGMLLKQKISLSNDHYKFIRSYYKKDKLHHQEESILYSHCLKEIIFGLTQIKFKKIEKSKNPKKICNDQGFTIKRHIFVKE